VRQRPRRVRMPKMMMMMMMMMMMKKPTLLEIKIENT
jgi:hypothetical protein